MTVPDLEDALVEFIAANTYELRYYSNQEARVKMAPLVYCAFIPRDTVGDIVVGEVTKYPSIIVRAKSGVQSREYGGYELVTVELLIGVFDDTLNQQGSRDCLQIIERIKQRVVESSVIRQRFPLRLPLNWQINKKQSSGPAGDYNAYPYYFGEMQLLFHMPLPSNQYEATFMSSDGSMGRLDVPAVLTPKPEPYN
jgi:hypothetical protein